MLPKQSKLLAHGENTRNWVKYHLQYLGVSLVLHIETSMHVSSQYLEAFALIHTYGNNSLRLPFWRELSCLHRAALKCHVHHLGFPEP